MAKCAYCGENIIRIEEKWIDENVKDEEEKRIRKELYKFHGPGLLERSRGWSS
ncbi:MAG: hypothetical protein QXU31_07060 [Archaeoglobaceae archaeon]